MTFFKKTLHDVPLAGKTVLVRVDYNVPLTKDGRVSDDFRIKASVPTLQHLLEQGCKVVIISHLGRPGGVVDQQHSLRPVAKRLAELLGREVRFSDNCIGDRAYQTAKTAPPGTVVMFENLRFHAEEETGDNAFARAVAKASSAQYFVQDGFGAVHRTHASIVAIPQYLPSVAGLLLAREYTTLTDSITNPKRPLVAVLGGAKVSDKITVIKQFVEHADTILIGGAMANTFLAHRGMAIGASIYESDQDSVLDAIAAAVDETIVLPTDVAVGRHIAANEPRREVSVDAIATDDIALDVGEATVKRFVSVVDQAGTVIWNGPLGYCELAQFSHGSARLALALATHPNIVSIIGGGDTVDFVLKWDGGGGKSFSHVSTGGGASLELMAGNKLPGVEVLLDASR